MNTLSKTIACSMMLLVGACAPDASLDDGDPFTGPTEGKLSNNGLVLDFALLDLLKTSPLSTESADFPLLDEAEFDRLIRTEGGAELLSYLVTCALGEDADLRVPSTGAVFSGNLGLAPQWLEGECDEDCQRWVSACVLAHTNDFGMTVQISPRGGHESLAWDEGIEEAFSYEEAAYYGNLFLPEGQRIAIVCGGASLYADNWGEETNGDVNTIGSNFVNGRVSGAGTETIEFAGLCSGQALPGVPDSLTLTSACQEQGGGFYEGCLESSYEPGALRYSEVITVFLAR